MIALAGLPVLLFIRKKRQWFVDEWIVRIAGYCDYDIQNGIKLRLGGDRKDFLGKAISPGDEAGNCV